MVGWRRHLFHSIARGIGNSLRRRAAVSAELSGLQPASPASMSGKNELRVSDHYFESVTLMGKKKSSKGNFPTLWRVFGLSSDCIPCTYHRYLQALGISSSRRLPAESDESTTPVRSPLTPVLAIDDGKKEAQAVVTKPNKVQAVRKNIKQSPKKVNLVAALVRGMRVEDALLQLQVTVKRAAKTVYQVINSARANASHNHGMDPDRLIVAEAFVGKGFFKKRVSYHAKGRSGIMVRPECRLTVVVREITPEEEAEIARLRVSKFRKLTKREKRLVPHQLIEVTPRWSRKNRPSESATADAAA